MALFALLLSILTTTAPAAVVDLHAHPFMKEGMSFLFNGDFQSKLRAKDWTARFDSMLNEETLEAAYPDLGLMVVSLYTHPILGGDTRQSIRRQLKAAHEFSARSKNWRIARTPREGMNLLKEGKGVLILALEGASGILETEADLKEFIDEGGIRIVTFLHLTDDHYGGAAFMKGIKGIMTPVAWLTQLFHPLMEDGVMINRNGVTEEGIAMAKNLMARKVWVDLAHAPDEAQRKLIPLLTESDRPLLYTHTFLRKYHQAERAIASWQVSALKKSRGVLGLMPSEDNLSGLDAVPGACPAPCQGACSGEAVFGFLVHFKELAAELGAESVMLGTDLNGGVPHLRPASRCGALKDGLDTEGVWNVTHLGRVERLLVAQGLMTRDVAARQPLHFLQTWQRIWQVEGH